MAIATDFAFAPPNLFPCVPMVTTRILIVEDEAIIAEDMASYLHQSGYEVVDIVATGEQAIEATLATQPDLILMDIMLRGTMDGVEAAQKIYSCCDVPIVYLTANADDITLERAKATSPFGYILKPYKEKELGITIDIALSRHRSEKEVQKALVTAETLRQAAETSSKLNSQYFSMASHELRTPISVIQFSVELLQTYGDCLPKGKRQQTIQRIQDATESLNQLLEDVLILGRASAGKFTQNFVSIEVITFCQQLLEPIWVGLGERFTLKFVHPNVQVHACLDEKLFWHLLNNLLSNAIKYSPQGGLIELEVFPNPDLPIPSVVLRVSDQGIGIPIADQARLFEPFHRASNVGKIPGSGLGLAIVKRSVELQNGTISLESQPGKGTTFTVTLPLEQEGGGGMKDEG